MKRHVIDLNSDVGESFGPYRMGSDEELFPYITSANIACGFHAGDPITMRRTLEMAAENHVAVGAHPGFEDRLHFGRIALPYSHSEIVDMVLYQIGALQMMAQSAGLELQHVKLHGALYHLASEDSKLAELFLDAIVRTDQPLVIVGPPNSVLQREAEERGLDYAAEGFADRAYDDEGKLVSRAQPNSILSDPEAAASQAVSLATRQSVNSISGKTLPLTVQTICVHGDTPGAAEIAEAVRRYLEAEGVAIERLKHLVE